MQTSLGEIPLWGQIRPGRPVLLLIRGALAEPRQAMSLVERVTDCSVVLAHLPGHLTPPLSETSVHAFGRAFDEVVESLAAPTLVVGLSIGGAVAMAMSCPNVRRRLIADTPLRTAPVWPLVDVWRPLIGKYPHAALWAEGVFGLTESAFEGRDFRSLVKPGVRVLVGSELLGEPRQITRVPSIVSEEDRAHYVAAGAHLEVVENCGHHIIGDGWPTFWAALKQECAALVEQAAAEGAGRRPGALGMEKPQSDQPDHSSAPSALPHPSLT